MKKLKRFIIESSPETTGNNDSGEKNASEQADPMQSKEALMKKAMKAKQLEEDNKKTQKATKNST